MPKRNDLARQFRRWANPKPRRGLRRVRRWLDILMNGGRR